MKPGISCGSAREDEIERLLEIHLSAFPDERGLEPRRRNFLANPLGGFDRLYVARDSDGTPLAHAFLFALEAGFGGRIVPFAGIASVGVAPEARGRGVASALLGELHRVALAEGRPLTLLYAFRQGFYAKHGYVVTRAHRQLALAPRSLGPLVAKTKARALPLRAARSADRPAIEALHANEALRRTGWQHRTAARWDRLFADERLQFFVAVRNDVTVGYLSSRLLQDEPHARTVLQVDDLVASDVEARAALHAHLYAQRDQAVEIHLAVADDDPLELALTDADSARHGIAHLEHALGTIAGGPMLRLADWRRALLLRGYPRDGHLILDVEGEREVLDVQGGRATLRAITPSDATLPTLALDRPALAALAFGGWPLAAVESLGAQVTPDERSAEVAAFFTSNAYFCTDSF